MSAAEEFRSTRGDLATSVAMAMANVAAHVTWNPISSYWLFAFTALAFTGVSGVWLVRRWRGLKLTVTRFYCAAALLDLLSEGLLQPFHHDTRANIVCTVTMFGVFVVYWLVLRPLEQRTFLRKWSL